MNFHVSLLHQSGSWSVINYLTLAYSANEHVQNVPEEILEVGDKIAVFLHFQAWPKGGGQTREGYIADVYTVREGKVVQMQAYADPAEARKAIGLPPRAHGASTRPQSGWSGSHEGGRLGGAWCRN